MKVDTHFVIKMKQIYYMIETWMYIIEGMEWATGKTNLHSRMCIEGDRMALSSGNKQKPKLAYSTHMTTSLCCFCWLEEAKYI